MASKKRVAAALDIMRRMPPSRIEQSLAGIINLSPDDTEELLQVRLINIYCFYFPFKFSAYLFETARRPASSRANGRNLPQKIYYLRLQP